MARTNKMPSDFQARISEGMKAHHARKRKEATMNELLNALKEAQQVLHYHAAPLLSKLCKEAYGHDQPVRRIEEVEQIIQAAIQKAERGVGR